MCGIAAIVGPLADADRLERMLAVQSHRGPDAQGRWRSSDGRCRLGHRRLQIIDRSPGANQPMQSADGRLLLVFNGEIYNYRELRTELRHYPFRTQSDSEVLLAALQHWGEACLDRLLGMFAFVAWDEQRGRLIAARDRFGVKPLYYASLGDTLLLASEIKALHSAGVSAAPNESTWAGYFAHGDYGDPSASFWRDVFPLAAGHVLTWEAGQTTARRWYDFAARVAETDERSDEEVGAEYTALLRSAVDLRLRADVEVGINLSGGLDSATLLATAARNQGADASLRAVTFVTGDARYDELPWAHALLHGTRHRGEACALAAKDVPVLAASVQHFADEPFGGIPTLAYARLFERARELGLVVLLDGQGMDEQWAGYDYYRAAGYDAGGPTLQAAGDAPLRCQALDPDFRALAAVPRFESPFGDRLRNIQLRDICATKIPRALRFNDRASMRASTELREPFLDHRLVELAVRQPAQRKVRGDIGKVFLRELASSQLGAAVSMAPKRSVQTPQREWLRGPLQEWAADQIESMLGGPRRHWFRGRLVRDAWQAFCAGDGESSFFVWQWISLALLQPRFS